MNGLLLDCDLTRDRTRELGAAGRSNPTGQPGGRALYSRTSRSTPERYALLSSSSGRGGAAAPRGRGTHQGRSAGRGGREGGPPESPARSPAASPARSREAARRGGQWVQAPGLPPALLSGARPFGFGPGARAPPTGRPELHLGAQRPRSRASRPGATPPRSRPGAPSSARFRHRKSARSSPGNGTAHAPL